MEYGYGADEEKGRFLLRSLLCLVFVCAVAGQVLAYAPVSREDVLPIALPLLPAAVVLWAVHRGSWPGLVVFFIGAFNALIALAGLAVPFQAEALARPEAVVDLLSLLLRLTAVFCIFREEAVGRWLDCRRRLRRRRDLALEIALYVLSWVPCLIFAVVLLIEPLRMGG